MRYKKGDVVKKSELTTLYDDISERLEKVTIRKDPIRPGQTVYFDRSCDAPRRAFKKDYPDNKVVYDPNEADIIIANANVRYYYRSSYDDVFSFVEPGKNYWQLSYKEEVTLQLSQHINILNHVQEKYEMVMSGKPFVSDMMIKAGSTYGRKMDDGEKASISKMISTADVEMAKLGLNMLTGFDMEENEEAFVLAFLQMRHTHLLSSSRVLKAMKAKLKAKYVNLRI